MSSGGLAAEGRLARVFVREQPSDAWTPVKGLTSVNRNGTQGEAECTDFDSEGNGEWLTGISNATYAFNLNNHRGLDPGQEMIIGAITKKTRPLFRYYPVYAPLSGQEYFEGRFFSTTDDRVHELETAGQLNLTLRASGENREKQDTVNDQV